MNRQLLQLASLVVSAKRALRRNDPIEYIPSEQEGSITFSCLPHKGSVDAEAYCAVLDVSAWFEMLTQRELQDIKMLCPCDVKDKQLLGFSNTAEGVILSFFEDGSATCFVPDWQFDSVQKKWDVRYAEHDGFDRPMAPLHFENNTAEFREALSGIRELALQIGCSSFADIFGSAIDRLDGALVNPDKRFCLTLPMLPQENQRLLSAANLADVFGAMGSWNDSPLYMAHEKGLAREYETLSAELLKNIRLAVLYAVNEW